MKLSELLRLVIQNISQNKFKSIMTSIGIVVGAATIVMVIGIGRGGQMEVAEQFAQLNAGAINISYEYDGEEDQTGRSRFGGGFPNIFGGMSGGNQSFPGGGSFPGSNFPGGGSFPGGNFPGGGGFSSGGNFPSGGSMPDGSDSSNGNNIPDRANMPSGSDSSSTDDFPGGGNFPGGGSMPDGGNFPGGGNTPDGAGFPGGDASGEAEDALPEGRSSEDRKASDREEMPEDGTAQGETENSEEAQTSMVDDRLNQEHIILSENDVADIKRYISGISDATITYSTKASIEGGTLTSAQTYTVAGVKENFAAISKLTLREGVFFTEEDEEIQNRICVLGASTAKELFGTSDEITGSTIYIDDRTYTVAGVFESSSVVASDISTDTSVFVPYETGIKYITGESIDPIITVLAEDVDVLDSVIEKVRIVLEENYSNATFAFEDSGSKMQAAKASNRTLTMLLSAMAAIVFFVGGIGIMNVLFVSIKERTNEIGILKAIGMQRAEILLEFLIESAAISCIGGLLGCAISFAIVPLIEYLGIRIETTGLSFLAALGFSVLTGTIFGIYPAWKASRLEPVEALNSD